jgi:hypothetical protein
VQQPHVVTYADIDKERIEVQAANCNRLLADSWVLMGVYPDKGLGNSNYGVYKERKCKETVGGRYERGYVGL